MPAGCGSRQMVEHYARWQARPQIGGRDDLVAAHMDLHVPAEIVYPLGQRRDHIEGGHGSGRIKLGEADAANSSCSQRLQFGVRYRRMDDRNATGIVAKLGYGVERDPVVGDVDRRRDNHGAGGPDALLVKAIFRQGCARLHARARP